MFSRASENRMLSVRAALLVAWLILIGSSFHDPFSPEFTRPENRASPFHIQVTRMQLRGTQLDVEPYAMGNRVFWTMILPLVPLFLMIFGHEAWRRICPLSFASQLPRYLGLQRVAGPARTTPAQRRDNRHVKLIPPGSWFHRNAWYVQLTLLYGGVCARILFINSDRFAFACVVLGVIAAAVAVGALWGGKTWCNYFCPANVVQRIYTEPGGLLESSPHLTRPAIPQSMCRTAAKGGDKSACVGCQPDCGDIDLEGAYWKTISDPARKHVYYLFTGLVLGFYGYYYLYTGSWDYYFSGVWTHEKDQLRTLLEPGMYLSGWTLGVPKALMVPLVIAAAMGLSLALSLACERVYRHIRRRLEPVPEAELRNHCLAASAYVSINLFYVFAGRPNINLMPALLSNSIDVLILVVSTLWLWRTVRRTPASYQQPPLTPVPVTPNSKLGAIMLNKVSEPPPRAAHLVGHSEDLARTATTSGQTPSASPQAHAAWESSLLSSAPTTLWSGGRTRLRCVKVTHETLDVKTYTFVSAAPSLFYFKPGQYVTLELRLEGRLLRRSYTISSSPSRPHTLSITVKRVPKGWVSNWLYEKMTEGVYLELTGPYGEFSCFNSLGARRFVLICAGSGVTPMMSMLRTFADMASAVDIIFINNVSTPADIIFREELYHLGTRLGRSLRMVIVPSVVPYGETWFGPTGRFGEKLLLAMAPDFQEREVFVCGPPGYMQTVRSILENLHYPMEHYHEESFDGSAPAAPRPAALETPPVLQVFFAKQGKSVVCREKETILVAAERGGVVMKSACRSGTCGACILKKLEGEVRMDEQMFLSQADIDAGAVLSCISYPQGRVVLDA